MAFDVLIGIPSFRLNYLDTAVFPYLLFSEDELVLDPVETVIYLTI